MNKTRQWVLLTAVACLAVLAAGWFLVVKPERSHAASLRTDTQGVLAKNNALRTQVDQWRQQQRDLPAQQKKLAAYARQIPDNPALPALIRQLSSAADGAGVTLVSLAPTQPTAPVPTNPAAAITKAAPGAASYLQIPITVEVTGTYFNVEQFFAAVEQLNRAVLVSGFNIGPLNGPTSGGTASTTTSTSGGAPQAAPGTLKATLNAVVFESPSVAAATFPQSSTSTVH